MIYIKEEDTKKVPGLTSLFISFNYKQELVDAVKTIPCSSYDKKTNLWEIPLSYTNDIIDKLSLYDDIDIIFKEEINDTQIFKLSKYKTKPYKYQEEGIQYGLNHKKWLLLDAPGLGKTLQLVYLAAELKKHEKIDHCLIICGVNNLKMNWKKEIEKHSNLSCRILGEKINRKGRLVIGSVKERVDQLLKPIKEFFIITNIETLREDEIIKALDKSKNKIDLIALDEAHCCKSSTSQQAKHLLKLNKNKYGIGMTGTLLLNDPLDAYVVLKWLGLEKSSLSTFKYHYCIYTGPFHNILLGFRNIDLLKYQLSKCSLRRTKGQVLELPNKNIIDEYVEMDDRQALFYDNIKNGIIEEVDKVHISTASLLSMVARLRQATAFPGILTTENIQSAKILRACELVQQIVENGDKVVIFSTFKDTVYELGKLLTKYNPLIVTGDTKDSESNKAIDDFQNKEDNKVFIGTWQKCGTGITLTEASYMIFIDTPWTFGVFDQCCDRIYRIGTKKTVFIYNLITKDTIDERVLEILNSKEAISNYVIDDKVDEKSIDSLRKYIQDLK